MLSRLRTLAVVTPTGATLAGVGASVFLLQAASSSSEANKGAENEKDFLHEEWSVDAAHETRPMGVPYRASFFFGLLPA